MAAPLATMDPLVELARPQAGKARQPSILDLPHVAIVSRGRAAIALALQDAGIDSGAGVLMPAYNCPAMTAGVTAAGASPQFFPVTETLDIDPRQVVAAGDARTRAVLIPHFFAWRQRSTLFEYIAANTNWLMIEDCAHAFFGAPGGQPIGAAGHVAIASVAKFFPSRWGGVVGSASRPLRIPLRPASRLYQLKLAANALEEAASFGRLGAVSGGMKSLLGAVSRIRQGGQAPTEQRSVADAGSDTSYANVDAGRLYESGGWWVMRQIVDRRYFAARAQRRLSVHARLQQALGDLRHAALLNPQRPPDFPPYVFPLLLRDQSQRRFEALRSRGVPMFRWEHSAAGRCAVTDSYAASLVQLPCHDALGASELEAIIAAVRSELG